MNRRDFARSLLGLLLGGPGLPYVGQQTIVTPKTDANCGICGNPAVFRQLAGHKSLSQMWCTRVCKRLAEAISWRLLLETTKVRDQGRRTLLFLYHQLPIFNPQVRNKVWQL